jgi:hypothetical protein
MIPSNNKNVAVKKHDAYLETRIQRLWRRLMAWLMEPITFPGMNYRVNRRLNSRGQKPRLKDRRYNRSGRIARYSTFILRSKS